LYNFVVLVVINKNYLQFIFKYKFKYSFTLSYKRKLPKKSSN